MTDVLKAPNNIDATSVNIIFSNITGLYSEHAAAVFAINVTQHKNIDSYNDKFKIQSSEKLLIGLRYLVQNFFMGGMTMTIPVPFWINGYEADFITSMTQGGDFY